MRHNTKYLPVCYFVQRNSDLAMCRVGSLHKLIALCKIHGFVVETASNRSHQYFSYGPLGTDMRRNLREEWWRDMVISKGNIYSLEDPYLTQTGEVNSQHLCFADTRGLKSKLLEYILEKHANDLTATAVESKLQTIFKEFLVFPGHKSTEQHLESVFETIKAIPGIKLPFGFAKISKHLKEPSEQYLFRSPEEETMSLQFLCDERKAGQWMNHWRRQRLIWWRKFANNPSHFSLSDKQKDGSRIQVQYKFPWSEEQIENIVQSQHIPDTQLPLESSSLQLIQTEASLNKGFLVYLMDAYEEKERADSQGNVSLRKVLHLHPRLAPVKVTVLPESLEKMELSEVSQQLATELRGAGVNALHMIQGSPDECYVHQDEIGTPYCITILNSTLANGVVTLRSRNTTLQEFIHISEVVKTIKHHLGM